MPIQDLRAIPADATLEADVCVVGSGPAGATVALELAYGNSKVIVVESGGLQRDTEVDQLNEIENTGWPRIMDQWLVRNRMLGGTSNTWAPVARLSTRSTIRRGIGWLIHDGPLVSMS
jgi:choline dehydrogenase-like flavoprotein